MILLIILISISSVNAAGNDMASDDNLQTNENDIINLEIADGSKLEDDSADLENEIINANNGDEILIEPGTYNLHNIEITKNLTLQGNGKANDIIIDGEHKSSIFLIRSDAVHVSFKNITFINANVTGFGGAISMETGHVYVDNCNFYNNSASVNAGGISNYGTEEERGYLLVNNSLFVNNHAGHDGGAITTCYASSDIYNCVFIANSAHRDGGAIRVSVFGYGNVEDCIFMYNHADEWGGAYYSWASNSKINRCIFMNNTGGTNGGAVMVSGNMSLTNSIIVNNTSNETGGSFYIQQPMFDATTVIDVHDNLITNNTSPLGKEIYIKWNTTKLLFTKFNNNDWGDEDPTDSDVIDPDHVTKRSKVTSTKKSNLLNELNLNLLFRYSDVLKGYFPEGYFDSSDVTQNTSNAEDTSEPSSEDGMISDSDSSNNQNIFPQKSNTTANKKAITNSTMSNPNDILIPTNGSSEIGLDSNDLKKASEIFEHSPSKTINSMNVGAIIFAIIAAIALLFGYKRNKKEE